LANHIDLAGRRAVVTGGVSGLGLGITRRFLESGAEVMVWDVRDTAIAMACAELAPLGRIHGRSVDVGSVSEVDAATADAATRMGGIDILVNSAGINRPAHAIENYPMKDWDDIIRVDLTGVFVCCRAVIPVMTRGGYGRVINIASIAGKEGNPRMAAYSAAKAGVIAMTKSLAREVAGTGVIVNAIAPTIIDTPMNRASSAAAPELLAQLLARIPLGRRGDVEELAAMAAWVASEECSFTTGFTFDLSGGRTTY
jgi:2-dehydro-3-deoxy-L-rhamnonate dehydrogenase (NAD+)